MACVDYIERKNDTINHIRSESIKLAKTECKARYDWVDKVIYWELCKRIKFEHPNKWFIPKQKFILKKKT